MPLNGHTAIITGGGRGIGAACARELAEAGARVVVTARSEDQIQAVAESLAKDGHDVLALPCDVSDPMSIKALHEAVVDQVGVAKILVNNAGIAPSGPFLSIDLEDWNRTLSVNTTGAFLMAQAFLPDMISNGWGRIVNVASVAAKIGGAYIAAYVASKHALLGLTKSLALEFRDQGITCNAVCPGYVDTPMTDANVEKVEQLTGRNKEDSLKALLKTGHQKELISPEDVANVVRFLCEDRASRITGQSMVIDGVGVMS